MNIQSSQSFPGNLAHLAESGAYIYDNGQELVACGGIRKAIEYIKGAIFNGAFGIYDRTSSLVIGNRLVTILKQNKQTITKAQLTIIDQIAKRAYALGNVNGNQDHATLKLKLANRVAKFEQKLNQLPITTVAPKTPVASMQAQTPSEDVARTLAEQKTADQATAEVSVEDESSLQKTVDAQEVSASEAQTADVEAQELPSTEVLEEPVQTWGLTTTKIAVLVGSATLAAIGAVVAGKYFSAGNPEMVDTCRAMPSMISDKPANSVAVENLTSPAMPSMISDKPANPVAVENLTSPARPLWDILIRKWTNLRSVVEANDDLQSVHTKQETVSDKRGQPVVSLNPDRFFVLTSSEGFKGVSKRDLESLYGLEKMPGHDEKLSLAEQRDFYNHWAKAIAKHANVALETALNATQVAEEACESRHALRQYTHEVGSLPAMLGAQAVSYVNHGSVNGLSCDQIFKKYDKHDPVATAQKIVERAGSSNDDINWLVERVEQINGISSQLWISAVNIATQGGEWVNSQAKAAEAFESDSLTNVVANVEKVTVAALTQAATVATPHVTPFLQSTFFVAGKARDLMTGLMAHKNTASLDLEDFNPGSGKVNGLDVPLAAQVTSSFDNAGLVGKGVTSPHVKKFDPMTRTWK